MGRIRIFNGVQAIKRREGEKYLKNKRETSIKNLSPCQPVADLANLPALLLPRLLLCVLPFGGSADPSGRG